MNRLADIKKRIVGQGDQVEAIYRAISRKSCLLPNVTLVMGHTGSGKTHITKLVAEQFDIPIVEIDATFLTAKGWSDGHHIDTQILLQGGVSGYSNRKLLVIVDEFDKIGRPAISSGGQDHHRMTQQNFLKLIDGTTIQGIDSNGREITSNTSNIIWVFLGAFSDMKEDVQKISGFSSELMQDAPKSMKEKLIDYGFMPELVGRILTVVQLDDTSKKMFCDYLENPDSPFNVQLNEWRKEHGNLPDVNYAAVLTEAEQLKLGMRGLLFSCQKELDAIQLYIETKTSSIPKSFKR